MERFASIKPAGKRRKLDVSTICRCCGMQSDDKIEILGQFSDDGVDFKEKMEKLTGISVTLIDRMPQSMCDMCVDKINDFYEFRLMAQNTEIQTREALGLPAFKPFTDAPQIVAAPKQEPKVKIVSKYSAEDTLLIDKALDMYKNQTSIPSSSKRRSEKAVVAAPPAKKSRKDVSCNICEDVYFGYLTDLNDHLMKDHIPSVAKYACGSCQETFEQLSDHKAHESLHSKEKLPYTCFFCLSAYVRPRDYNKHMTNYNCPRKPKLEKTIEDIKCFQCKKKFLTQNLFEWHACFLKNKGNCSKCGQFYQKKKALFKHYVLCEGHFEAPQSARGPSVKAEPNTNPEKVTANTEKAAGKGPKKKTLPNRKMSTHPDIVKKELNIGPPVEDDDYANYEEDITYDNFGNDSDSNDAPTNDALEPLVQLQEQPTVRIKQEPLSDRPAVQQKSVANHLSSELIRNIKKEKGVAPTTIVTTNSAAWKLKIKGEKGGNQASTKVLNPMAVGTNKPATAQKNVFKIPQGLAMKIKMEKKDAGYGDEVGRDEAEAEDEDLLGETEDAPVKIKQEKMDPGYGDSHATAKTKQLINPMALMMREKSTSNGLPEKSLVISAVTSINPESPGEPNESDDTMTQSEISSNALETPETNDVTVAVKPRDDLMMVQIPREFTVNQENHSSQSAECDESSVATASENDSKEQETEFAPPAESSDDLDALLKKYEETAAPADNNDLFNDLLKFD